MRWMASVAVLPVGDELGDQGIVIGRDDAVLIGVGVDADANAAGEIEARDAAGRGREGVGVFRVDAALDGVAAANDGTAENFGQSFPGGDSDLRFDEVDAGDGFGDGVLDLDAGIYFDEVEVALFVHEEFDGAGVAVADGFDGFFEFGGNALTDFGAQGGGGRFLKQLLVTPLDAAFALAQDFDVAVLVGKDLEFDVTRGADEFFADRRRRSRKRRRLPAAPA